jgi:hypothetical protein
MADFSFFHCFSRRASLVKDYSNELFILENILNLGLLLVPETTFLAGEPFAEGQRGMPIQFIQRRLSLTLLAEPELPAHRARFGDFAVEFDLVDGRRLGAVPVIYLPQPSVDGKYQTLDSMSATILYRLREVYFVLADLSTLLRNVEGARDCDRIEMRPSSGGDSRSVDAAALRNVLETLEANKQPFVDLAATCQVIFHLFYPTDKRRSELDSMSLNFFYYQQREWRIFSDIIVGENRHERALSETEKNILCRRDSFFCELIETTDPVTNNARIERRVDLCRVLVRVDGRPPCAFIRRVWVPPKAEPEAAAMLRNSDCPAELRVNP